MAKKTIYRTVLMLEVLSPDPITDGISLETIVYESMEGSFSLGMSTKVDNQPVEGAKAVRIIKAHGSDPEFFQMDNDGNDIDL
jgi:hypothetical protein